MVKVVSNRYRQEYDLLKTTIDIVQEENVALKTKLAGLVQHTKLPPTLLQQAEQLHSQLVLLDDQIRKYKTDLQVHLKQNKLNRNPAEPPSKLLISQEDKLYSALEDIKAIFIELKQNLEKFIQGP